MKVLLLGGTREAGAEAKRLVTTGAHVTTSLAGRTREPVPVAGACRVGGFGGAEGLADYLRAHAVELLVDATHPFAVRISANARTASKATGVPLRRIERPPWRVETGDRWSDVGDISDAVHAIPGGSKCLLALGSQNIAPFAQRNDVHFVIRTVDEIELPYFEHVTRLLGRPGSTLEQEARILREHVIDVIVCRNSGGAGAYAKIAAARELQIPVIMIRRPTV